MLPRSWLVTVCYTEEEHWLHFILVRFYFGIKLELFWSKGLILSQWLVSAYTCRFGAGSSLTLDGHIVSVSTFSTVVFYFSSVINIL